LTSVFEPAAQAQVLLDGEVVGYTDSQGTLVYRRHLPPVVAHNGVEGESAPEPRTNLLVRWRGLERAVSFPAVGRARRTDSPVIYVHTDRGYYNPGQTVHVRALAWRLHGDYQPLADREVELQLRDTLSRRLMGGGMMRTDEAGIATFDLPLPPHAREGQYQLVALHGRERAVAELRVERFLPSMIDIAANAGRFVTPNQEGLTIGVTLGYFGGGAFESGQLQLALAYQGDELHRQDMTVQGAGPHQIVLDAEGLERLHQRVQPGAVVELVLTVRDGQERQGQFVHPLRYVAHRYQATIELDRTRYGPGEAVQAAVRVVDLDQVPLRNREIRLEVPSLRGPLRAPTDDAGLARFSFPMPRLSGDGPHRLRASMADVDGPLTSVRLPLEPALPMQAHVAEAVVAEGRPVTLEVLFPGDVTPVESVVHGDVTDSSGAIVHSFVVPVEQEGRRFVARGEFPAPTWGTLLLSLYCVGRRGSDVGVLTAGRDLTAHPARELQVRLTGIADSVPPGQSLEVGVEISTRAGQPSQSTLGVSVVDESALALLDPLTRSPIDHFYRAPPRVTSAADQGLTWPVLHRTWGLEQHDICWPPRFGFHPGLSRRRPVRPNQPDEPSEASGGLADWQRSRRAAAAVVSPGEGREAPESGDEAPRLVLRTDFAEPALWLPRLPAISGRGRFTVELPDRISHQRITVVASDAAGGVGVGRATVQVRQPLYVSSDLPASLVEGDVVRAAVAVRNLSDSSQRVQVSLESAELEVQRGTHEVAVPAGGGTVVHFALRAPRVGEASYRVTAQAAGYRAVDEGTLEVHPRGRPVVETYQGLATAGRPFAGSLVVNEQASHRRVGMLVSLPTVMPALQAMVSLLEQPAFGPDLAASRVLAATAIFRYLVARGSLDQDRRSEMLTRFGETNLALLMSQNSDGGWGWFWTPRSVPHLSAFVLRALLELRDLDLPVPDEAVIRATEFLLSTIGDDGFADLSGLEPWVRPSESLRWIGTAEIFELLTALPPAAQRGQYRQVVDGLSQRFRSYLQESEPEPLTLALGLLGLYRLHQRAGQPTGGQATAAVAVAPRVDGDGDGSAMPEELVMGAQRLVGLIPPPSGQGSDHLPFGGPLEALARVLEALAQLAPAGFDAERPGALHLLLSLRDSQGQWGDARTTAQAIRALLLLNPGAGDQGGALVVRVDGREVHRVLVDPRTPLASALALRSVELHDVPPGAPYLEVHYNGRLHALVTLELCQWSSDAQGDPSGAMLISRRVPPRLRLGGAGQLSLIIRADRPLGPLIIEQPIPAVVAAVPASLEALVAAGRIAGYELTDDAVALHLVGGAENELSFSVVGVREGAASLPPARARFLGTPLNDAETDSSGIVVRAR
jgi:hypothetical protein